MSNWYVVYQIEGYSGHFRQGPFSSERVIEEAADICGYEGVSLVRYEEGDEVTELASQLEAGLPQYDANVSSSEALPESSTD